MKSFCAFCHFFSIAIRSIAHSTALDVCSMYFFTHAHTFKHKGECTHFNSEIISISKHSLSLFFFIFFSFSIVVLCGGLLTNQIFVDQKRCFRCFNTSSTLHNTSQKWFIIKLLFFSLSLSLDVTYFCYFYCSRSCHMPTLVIIFK